MHKYNVTKVDISQTATCSLNLGLFVLRIGMIIVPLFLRYFFALASLHTSLFLYAYLHIIAMYIFFSGSTSVKILFSHEKEIKICFPIMWIRNTFFHKNNTLTIQIQQRNIFFSSRWQHKCLFSYRANFLSVRLGHWLFLNPMQTE